MARAKTEALRIPPGLRQFKRFIFKNKQSLESIALLLLGSNQGHDLYESHGVNRRLLYLLSISSEQSSLLDVIGRAHARRAEVLQYLLETVFNDRLMNIQQVDKSRRQCSQKLRDVKLRDVKLCHEQMFQAWPSVKHDEIHIGKEALTDFVAQHLFLSVWFCIRQRQSNTEPTASSLVKDQALLEALACLAQSVKRYPNNCQFFLHSAARTLREPRLAYERKCAILKECGAWIIRYNQPRFSFFSSEPLAPPRSSREETKQELTLTCDRG